LAIDGYVTSGLDPADHPPALRKRRVRRESRGKSVVIAPGEQPLVWINAEGQGRVSHLIGYQKGVFKKVNVNAAGPGDVAQIGKQPV
jgi:hypothetical protein